MRTSPEQFGNSIPAGMDFGERKHIPVGHEGAASLFHGLETAGAIVLTLGVAKGIYESLKGKAGKGSK